MRYAPTFPALFLLLSLHAPASAQSNPDIRYVIAPQGVAVRSGASDKPIFYDTNRLQRGAAVEVVRTENESWLAIRPPKGSFSYINTRFLKPITPNQPNWVTTFANVDVPVYIGSEVAGNRRPTVSGAKLKQGAQVISVGRPIHDPSTTDGGEFMPIEPPDAEVRFIPAASVDRKPPTVIPASYTTNATGDNRSTFTPVTGLAASNAPSANAPPSPEALCRCGYEAEKRGQIQEAIRLYSLAAAQTTYSNPVLAKQALDRAAWLQSGHQAYGAGGAGLPVQSLAPAASPGRVYALGGETGGSPVRMNAPPGARTVSLNGQAAATAPGSTSPTRQLPNGWFACKGRLRPAGRAVEGQKTYVVELEYPYLRPLAYTVSSPGVDLAGYVGRVVEVQGPAVYRGDLRHNCVTAMHVVPE